MLKKSRFVPRGPEFAKTQEKGHALSSRVPQFDKIQEKGHALISARSPI